MHPTSTTQAAPTRFGPAGSARPPGWGLVLAVAWRDGPALALAGLLAANAIHTINHAVDLDLGGHNWDPWGLASLTLLTAIALIVRLRQLGWVIGEVGTAATPALAPFVRQETVLLTSHRRDGRPVGTPVSMPGTAHGSASWPGFPPAAAPGPRTTAPSTPIATAPASTTSPPSR